MKTQPRKFTKNIPEQELINDVIAVAKKLNKNTVTYRDYIEHGKYGGSTLYYRFRSWYTVMEKAGLVATRGPYNITEEALLKNLEDVWNYLGRQPTSADMRTKSTANSQYSASTYKLYFGVWINVLKKFEEYQNSRPAEEGQIKKQVQYTAQLKAGEKKAKGNQRYVPIGLRLSVYIRDGFRCQCCGRSALTTDGLELHCDHIDPFSKGGKTVRHNLRTLCMQCNLSKGNR